MGRAVLAIAIVAAIAMTAKLGVGPGDKRPSSVLSPLLGKRATAELPPNLVAFATLPAADQRLYRRCLEGLQAAEDVRSTAGSWPTVEELAARGIPPFAADPIDGAGYRWQRIVDGTLVNYLGVPRADSSRPTWLITALEPDPGSPPDPTAVLDESHHRLRDGTLLHVSLSIGTARTISRAIAMPAFEDGWRLVVVASPP